ncbi:MAG: glycoside hydrolase family 13 protein [Clostridia bacterium]|nr:glycoside hydrolase family 13 protein [Clostridia bacterium]
MNTPVVIHRGRGIDCFALDQRTFRVRISTERGAYQRVELCYTLNKYTWNEARQTVAIRQWASDDLWDYYQTDVSGKDTRLAYVFILHTRRETFYFSEEGLSRHYAFPQGYCHFFQNPFIHACDVHKVVSWADTAVAYQIFPERFANGLGKKAYVNSAWDSDPTPHALFGGDLPGIEKHLDYLSDLGVNCLYLTPVFPSPSNHKYDVADYETVDTAFGGEAALRSLIDAVHKRNMRVLLDGVFNHCSTLFKPFQDAIRHGKGSAYWDWFFIEGDRVDLKEANYFTFGRVSSMPKLNTGHPEVIKYFCGIGAYWVREYHIDGWRLDVTDELSADFLRAFRKAVKAENPDALIVGEIWQNPASWLRGDQADGVMNYALTKALTDYLVHRTQDAQGTACRLNRLLARTAPQASRMMLNLIGSHDTHRFLTLLKGDKPRLKLAFCLLFFYVGIPCIYYGDEIGMEGGYDPGCRKGFPWEERLWDASLRELVKRLCILKTSGRLAGDEMAIEAFGDILSVKRSGAGLMINAADQPAAAVINGCTHTLEACEYRIDRL